MSWPTCSHRRVHTIQTACFPKWIWCSNLQSVSAGTDDVDVHCSHGKCRMSTRHTSQWRQHRKTTSQSRHVACAATWPLSGFRQWSTRLTGWRQTALRSVVSERRVILAAFQTSQPLRYSQRANNSGETKASFTASVAKLWTSLTFLGRTHAASVQNYNGKVCKCLVMWMLLFVI